MAERKPKAAQADPATYDDGQQGAGGAQSERGEQRESQAPQAPQAAPLDAPSTPAAEEVMPSSNDPVAANAALRTPSGSGHIRLLGEDGNDVDPESLFTFPGADSPSAIATVGQRVYQEFRYPGASTPTTHLLYPEGAQVPVAAALQVREQLRTSGEKAQ